MKSAGLFCPDVKSAEDSEVADERGGLDSVTAVTDRPAGSHADRKPRRGMNQARQALAAFENKPEYREGFLEVKYCFRHDSSDESIGVWFSKIRK